MAYQMQRKLNIEIINIFANTKTLNVNNTKLFGLPCISCFVYSTAAVVLITNMFGM